MASAIPIDSGIAGEQPSGSGDFFTFAVGTSFKGAEPTSSGRAGRVAGSRPSGRIHRRSAGGDGRPR